MRNVPLIDRETLAGVLFGLALLGGVRAVLWLGCKLLGVI